MIRRFEGRRAPRQNRLPGSSGGTRDQEFVLRVPRNTRAPLTIVPSPGTCDPPSEHGRPVAQHEISASTATASIRCTPRTSMTGRATRRREEPATGAEHHRRTSGLVKPGREKRTRQGCCAGTCTGGRRVDPDACLGTGVVGAYRGTCTAASQLGLRPTSYNLRAGSVEGGFPPT
jgi:hypothetical protein